MSQPQSVSSSNNLIQEQSGQSLHSLRIKPQQQYNRPSSNEHEIKPSHRLSPGGRQHIGFGKMQQSAHEGQEQSIDAQFNQDGEDIQDEGNDPRLESIQYQNIQSLQNLTSTQLLKKKLMQQKKSQISNFIIKTYRILQDRINHAIIEWTEQGNAFIVKNKELFENQILPKYFKHKKFSSFVRQLNMYDFHKIRKQKEIPIFKHKYFRQGCIDLLCRIKRKSGEQGIGDQLMDGVDNQMFVSNNNLMTKHYIPSLADLTEKPMASVYSLKSKCQLPYPSMLNSQPSIGLLPGSGNAHPKSQLQVLLQQNQQLTTTISQLAHEQVTLQMQRQRRRQKVSKIMNILANFDLNQIEQSQQTYSQIQSFDYSKVYTMRDLQIHFSSEEDPYSFTEYALFLKIIYRNVKNNLAKLNGISLADDGKEERKIEEEE